MVGGRADSEERPGGGQTEELLLLFSMLTPGIQAPCLQMFTYNHPPPALLCAQGLTEDSGGYQTVSERLWSPPVSDSFQIQRPDHRLETAGLYCKITQKSHGRSSSSTWQSTSQGQGPLETGYCIKRNFKNSVGTTEVHTSFPLEVKRVNQLI